MDIKIALDSLMIVFLIMLVLANIVFVRRFMCIKNDLEASKIRLASSDAELKVMSRAFDYIETISREQRTDKKILQDENELLRMRLSKINKDFKQLSEAIKR